MHISGEPCDGLLEVLHAFCQGLFMSVRGMESGKPLPEFSAHKQRFLKDLFFFLKGKRVISLEEVLEFLRKAPGIHARLRIDRGWRDGLQQLPQKR
jgi:hypothetical protein